MNLKRIDFFKNLFFKSWHSYLLIVIIGGLLYGKTISYDYSYLDDAVLVKENFYFLKDLLHFKKLFTKEVFLDLNYENAFYYRPLLNASFMIDAQFTESPSAKYFHLFNVIYHLIAVCMLFAFLLRLNYRREIVFLLTMIFLVHPVLTQAVGWIPGRNDTLLAIFVLGAFFPLVKIKEGFSTLLPRHWSFAPLLLNLFFFTLAVFTKENAIAMIPIFIFYLLFTEGNSKHPMTLGQRIIQRMKDKNFWFLIFGWIIIFWVWWEMKSKVLTYANKGIFENIFSNFMYNSPVILHYIGKLFFPVNLSVLPSIRDTTNIYGFLAVILLSGVLFFYRNKIRNPSRILFGAFWFFVFVFPPLVIRVPFLTFFFFEHRVYIPMMGFVIIFCELLNSQKEMKMIYLASGIIFILFLFKTFYYSDNFQDRYVFWDNAVRTSPSSAPSHLNRGINYFNLKKFDSAFIELNKTIELRPEEYGVHNLKGVIYLNQNRVDKAKKEFLMEIQIHPNSTYESFVNLGNSYLLEENYESALYYFQQAIQRNSRRGESFYQMGICYSHLNDMISAETAWKKAMELDPRHLQVRYQLIVYYANQKKYSEALKIAEEYIQLGGKLNERLYREILEEGR